MVAVVVVKVRKLKTMMVWVVVVTMMMVVVMVMMTMVMSYQMLEVLSFCNRESRSVTSFTKSNSANFSGEKRKIEAFRGAYNLRIREKTLSQISYS